MDVDISQERLCDPSALVKGPTPTQHQVSRERDKATAKNLDRKFPIRCATPDHTNPSWLSSFSSLMAESHRRRGGSRRGFVAKQSAVKDPPPQQENERDWSELPPEMLYLISKKLPDLPDLVRFRAVSQRWRSAASISDPSPQLPWFVRERWDYLENRDPQKKYVRLYSMYSGQIPKIKVPESHCKELKGTAHRYMLSFDWDQSSLSLLNPLTRREIPLPPLNLAWCELVCIRSDTRGAGDLVAIYGGKNGSRQSILGSCRVGDSNWMIIEQSDAKTCCRTYYNGMFYVHDQETRITEAIDSRTGDIVHLIPPQKYTATKPVNAEWCFDFFVESCGDLLGISSVYGRGLLDNNPKKCCFEIHRLDNTNRNPRWVQMKSIGDRFLFLHDSSGVSYNASDFPGFKRNSIYFLGSTMQRMNLVIVSSYLVVFDIEKGTAKRLHCPDDVETWFLPGLH